MSQKKTISTNYQTLFGDLDYPKIDEYESLFSPGAYFAELHYIKEEYFTEEDPNGKYALKIRRPDLWNIPLDKDHTVTERPYLELCNNVLKTFINPSWRDQNASEWDLIASNPYSVETPLGNGELEQLSIAEHVVAYEKNSSFQDFIILDMTNPDFPEKAFAKRDYGVILAGTAVENYVVLLYIASNDLFIEVTDFTKPTTPQHVKSFRLTAGEPGNNYVGTTVGSYAVFGGGNSIHIIDLTNPVDPKVLPSQHTLSSPIRALRQGSTVGNRAIFAGKESGSVHIIDMENLEKITTYTPAIGNDNIYGLVGVGQYAVLLRRIHGGGSRVEIYDMDNPQTPELQSSLYISCNDLCHLVVHSNTLFCFEMSQGKLYTIDLTDIHSIKEIDNTIEYNGSLRSSTVVANRVVYATYNNTVSSYVFNSLSVQTPYVNIFDQLLLPFNKDLHKVNKYTEYLGVNLVDFFRLLGRTQSSINMMALGLDLTHVIAQPVRLMNVLYQVFDIQDVTSESSNAHIIADKLKLDSLDQLVSRDSHELLGLLMIIKGIEFKLKLPVLEIADLWIDNKKFSVNDRYDILSNSLDISVKELKCWEIIIGQKITEIDEPYTLSDFIDHVLWSKKYDLNAYQVYYLTQGDFLHSGDKKKYIKLLAYFDNILSSTKDNGSNKKLIKKLCEYSALDSTYIELILNMIPDYRNNTVELVKLIYFVNVFQLEKNDIELLYTKNNLYDFKEPWIFTSVSLENLKQFTKYIDLKKKEAIVGTTKVSELIGYGTQSAATLLGRSLDEVEDMLVIVRQGLNLTDSSTVEPLTLDVLHDLSRLLEYQELLGFNIDDLKSLAALPEILNHSHYDTIRNLLEAALITKLGIDRWPSTQQQLVRKTHEAERNVLISMVLEKLAQDPDTSDIVTLRQLYEYLLIDVNTSGEELISELKLGILSIQLYINKALMGLENRVAITVDRRIWSWMMSYRTWQANREIFLYPENYLNPLLRQHGSHEYQDFVKSISQEVINKDNVNQAFGNFLHEFEKLSSLEVVDYCYTTYNQLSTVSNTLFIVAKTKCEPYQYYCRSAKVDDTGNIVRWDAWKKIEVGIHSSNIKVIHAFNRWFIFWVESDKKTSTPKDSSTKNIVSRATIKYVFSNTNNTWSATQILKRDIIFAVDTAQIHSSANQEALTISDYKEITQDPTNYLKLSVSYDQPSRKIRIGFGKIKSVHNNLELLRVQLNDLMQKKNVLVQQQTPQYSVTWREKHEWYDFDPVDRIYFSGEGAFGIAWIWQIIRRPGGTTPNAIISELHNDNMPMGYFKDAYHIIKTIIADESDFADSIPTELQKAIDNLAQYQAIIAEIKEKKAEIISEQERNNALKQFIKTDLDTLYSINELDELNQGLVHGYNKISNSHPTDLGHGFTLYNYTLDADFINDMGSPMVREDRSMLSDAQIGKHIPAQYIQNILHTYLLKGANGLFSDPLYDAGYAQDRWSSSYLWELFYHIPLYIAKKLNNNNLFADAKTWYECVFDPITHGQDQHTTWRFTPFINEIVNPVGSQLTDEATIALYQQDPFDPEAVAYHQIGSFEKYTVMNYIHNLIDWGDSLFAQYNWEDITQAQILYNTAYDLLGPKPRAIENIQHQPKTLQDLEDTNNGAMPEFLVNITKNNGIEKFRELNPLYKIASKYYFGVPANEQLLNYWSLIEDRLYKIQHSQNIKGIYQQLPLFQPPIDPNVLVTKTANVSLYGDATDTVSCPLEDPRLIGRFKVAIAQAHNTVDMVIQYGNAIAAALEKKDAEELQILTETQSQSLLHLITSIKNNEIDKSISNIDALQKNKEAAQHRKDHYDLLIKNDLLSEEKHDLYWTKVGMDIQIASAATKSIASPLHLFPNIFGLADGSNSKYGPLYPSKQFLC